MNMRTLLALLVFSSLIYSASLDVNAIVDVRGNSQIEANAMLSGLAGENFSLLLPSAPSSAVVRDRSSLEIPYSLRRMEDGKYIISATVPVDYLSFSIQTDKLTSKNMSTWIFDFVFSTSTNLSSVSASLVLPQGASLKSTSGAVSNEGETLKIKWAPQSLIEGQKAHMRANYEAQESITTTMESINWILLLVAIGAVAVGVFFLFRRKKLATKSSLPMIPEPESSHRIMMPKTHEISTKAPDAVPAIKRDDAKPAATAENKFETNPVFLTLDDTEKQIIREIVKAGGTTTQAQLNLNTHIPKVTLSGKLVSLENKGIVLKTQKGIRNLVSLTDTVKK